MCQLFYQKIHTPLADFLIGELDGALVGLFPPEELPAFVTHLHRFTDREIKTEEASTPLLTKTALEVSEYFEGLRTVFDLPLKVYGTPFQKQVWDKIAQISFGEVTTYGAIAAELNMEGARAVGTAVGKNPIPIIIPCHRVVPASGKLGNFSLTGGKESKRFLLALEGRVY